MSKRIDFEQSGGHIKPIKTVNGINTVFSTQPEKVKEETAPVWSIVNRVRTLVEDNNDYVSDFFIEIAKEFTGFPMVEVCNYDNTDTRLSLLKIDDKTVASVIETRTEFNHCEYIFSRLNNNEQHKATIDKVVEVMQNRLESVEDTAEKMSKICAPFKKEENRQHYIDGIIIGYNKAKSDLLKQIKEIKA